MLAACAGTSPPPSTQPTLSSQATRSAPATPPPSIAFRASRFDTTGLPAIARDGGIVVVPAIDSDGGRGFPNLHIELRDRRDRLLRTLPVMIANEYEALVPDGATASPILDHRIADTNRTLADLHRDYDLVPMQPASTDLAIDFAARGWLAPQGQRCAQCPPCENPPYVDAVYEVEGMAVRLVRVAYRGTDTCWEPSPQYHVIAR